jgi:O-antigen/teichoic acid export membrane protein
LKYSPRNLLKSELIRNTSVLITGTVVAQLISILLQPFLRRFFSAAEFGTFAVYSSMVGILAVISTLRYDDAIVLPDKDKDSANLLILSIGFNFLICIIALILIILFGNRLLIAVNLSAQLPVTVLYLVPLGAFLINTYQSFNYWLIRKKKFNNVSLNKLVRRGGEGVSQVTFAFSKISKGLIFSDIIGQIINVSAIIYQSFRFGFNLNYFSRNKIQYVFRKFSDFPKFNLLPAFMSTCSFLLPPIFINKYFSAENAGFFDMAKLVLSIPLALVATAISNVLLQRITEKYNSKLSLIEDLRSLLSLVFLICIVEILVIYLFGNELFGFAFGYVYEISGDISKIMVWSFAMNFIVSSFSCLFISMRKIKLYSIWQFFYFMSIISLLLFSTLGFFDFLKVYMLIEVFCYIVAALILVRIVFLYEKSINKA